MQRIIMNLLLVFLLFISFQNCSKDEDDSSDDLTYVEFIEEAKEDQNIPALSVLIFKDTNIVYENYLGKSNLAQNVALADNHLFLLASISKVVTATALLQLFEDGLFALDDKINDYLSFNVNNPNHIGDITFRMLLTHTSGIADGSALDGQYYYNEDSPVNLGYFIENYLVVGGDFYNASENFHDFAPGTDFEYSNVGNALIGLLVEKISGTGFNSYCKQNIFVPLGMTNTFWRLDEISQTIVQPYNYTNGSYQPIQHYTFTDYPNGGLRSTGRDMFIFLSAFVQNGVSNNHTLLSASTVNSILTPQIPSLDNSVGLHMFVMNATNSLWGHDGGEQGVATIMAFNPSNKVGAIILSNQGEADLDEILVKSYEYGLSL